MSNYKKHIDDFFKEKLGNYRESPPPEAWSEIDAKLDGLTPGPAGFQYRWFVHIGIVSLLLVLGVSLLRNYTNTQGQGSGSLAMNATPADAATQAAPSTGTAATEQSTTAGTNLAADNNANTTAPGQSSAANTANNPGANGNNNVPATATTAQKNKNAGVSKQASAKQSASHKTHYIQPAKIGFANNTTTNNIYNSTLSNTHNNLSNPAPETEANDNQLQAASPNTTLSVVTKPEAQVNNAKTPVNKPNTSIAAKNSNTRTQPSFPRFEAGVKAGYEGGFSNGAANQLVVSPYVQYNLSPKFSVMTQPGVKFSATPDRTIGTPQTYYDANPELGSGVTPRVLYDTSGTTGGGTTRYYSTAYTFSRTHDSVIKTNRIGSNTMEFEIPILLKYNLTKKLSVYGGVNFEYNKYTSINTNTYTKGVTRYITDTVSTINTPPAAPQSPVFTYTGNPIADYQKLNAAHTGYEFSTGYMIGFSYAYSKKWLFDALVEQNPATPDMKSGYNINTPLSSTYFRLSIGYKLK